MNAEQAGKVIACLFGMMVILCYYIIENIKAEEYK